MTQHTRSGRGPFIKKNEIVTADNRKKTSWGYIWFLKTTYSLFLSRQELQNKSSVLPVPGGERSSGQGTMWQRGLWQRGLWPVVPTSLLLLLGVSPSSASHPAAPTLNSLRCTKDGSSGGKFLRSHVSPVLLLLLLHLLLLLLLPQTGRTGAGATPWKTCAAFTDLREDPTSHIHDLKGGIKSTRTKLMTF